MFEQDGVGSMVENPQKTRVRISEFINETLSCRIFLESVKYLNNIQLLTKNLTK
jgi:hypothetical protein